MLAEEYRDADPQFNGQQPCMKSLLGTCPNAAGSCDAGPHPDYPQGKNRVCSFYQDVKRGCSFGDKCHGLHIGVGRRRAIDLAQHFWTLSQNKKKTDSEGKAPGTPRGKKKEACRKFKEGTCTKGDKCPYSHKQ